MATQQSLRELATQILTDIEGKTNQDTPVIDVAYNRAISNGVAGLSLLNQVHDIDQRKECFPQTASEDLGLVLWSGLVNRPRGAGVQAELQIEITGSDGTTIGTGTTGPKWLSDSGITYSTTSGATITGGIASVSILSSQYGTEGTLQIGDEVTLTTTKVGINGTATVTAINVVGSEAESVESWRAAIVQLAAFPPNVGTASWFYTKALSVPGITRAYPYVSQTFPGRIELYCVADDNTDGIPSDAQLEDVEAIMDEAYNNIMWAVNILPNGQKRLEAFASPIDEYDVVITDGTPSLSATEKELLETSINNYFLTRNPYINGLSLENQGSVEEVAITATAQNTLDSQIGTTGKFTEIGLQKVGEAPASVYSLDIGTRAKANISYS